MAVMQHIQQVDAQAFALLCPWCASAHHSHCLTTLVSSAGAHDLRIAPPLPLRKALGRPARASSLVSIACRYPGAGPDTGAPGFVDTLRAERDLPSPAPLQVLERRPSRLAGVCQAVVIHRADALICQLAHQQGYAPVIGAVWCLQHNQPHEGMHSCIAFL